MPAGPRSGPAMTMAGTQADRPTAPTCRDCWTTSAPGRAIAHERRRFGYRRLQVLLKREGYVINHKKLFRLCREEKLAVRRRGGRKRAIGTRAPLMVPVAPNDRWSLDFVSDQLTFGRRVSAPT